MSGAGANGDAPDRWAGALAGLAEQLWAWRRAHPTATFNEIEDAVDAQVQDLRAVLLTDLSLASRAAELEAKQAGVRPRCPDCGARLARHGTQRRHLLVQGGQAVDLVRDYAVCPVCGTGLFPPG